MIVLNLMFRKFDQINRQAQEISEIFYFHWTIAPQEISKVSWGATGTVLFLVKCDLNQNLCKKIM